MRALVRHLARSRRGASRERKQTSPSQVQDRGSLMGCHGLWVCSIYRIPKEMEWVEANHRLPIRDEISVSCGAGRPLRALTQAWV